MERYSFRIRRTDEQGNFIGYDVIPYRAAHDADTVASALRWMTAQETLRNEAGETVSPPAWDCGCLQGRCGACAMRINGTPKLSCKVFLAALKKRTVVLEPLMKFPVVRDLMVDRSQLFSQLLSMRVYREGDARNTEGRPAGGEMMALPEETLYEASRCLQCGICLEVCPNYVPGEAFYGMASMVPHVRKLLLSEEDPAKETEAKPFSKKKDPVRERYEDHIYRGCGKSLSCRDICPAGIDIDGLLVKSNRIAVFGGKMKRSLGGAAS